MSAFTMLLMILFFPVLMVAYGNCFKQQSPFLSLEHLFLILTIIFVCVCLVHEKNVGKREIMDEAIEAQVLVIDDDGERQWKGEE